MKIGILSRNRSLYSTRRLIQAARLRGHEVITIDTLAVAVEVGVTGHEADTRVLDPSSSSTIAESGQSKSIVRLPTLDAIIPRIGASITHYGVAVVRQFEAKSTLTTAASHAIAQSRDKLHSLQIMSQAGLPIPKTAVIAQPEALYAAVQAVGGPPVVIKLIRGTQGRGVILAPNLRTTEVVMDKLRAVNRQALVQEFVAEAAARDTRILIVGDRCVAAMERRAAEGDFRANLHRGGTARSVYLDKATEQLAVAAARAHGLSVAGVDIIHSKRGPLLLEVNSSPGLQGIEQVSKTDIATEIVRFLERAARKNKKRRSRKRKRH